MNPQFFLFLWVGSQALQLVFAAAAYWRRPPPGESRRLGSLYASAAASVLPLVTLVLFVRVFVIGGSSNVAQLAGEAGLGLWSLWAAAWLPLFCGNPVVLVVVLVAAILPPYPPRHWPSFLSRWSAVPAAACAWYAVVTWFPDA